MLKLLKSLLVSKEKIGTLLHIGVGSCPEFEVYRSMKAENILLVEPEQSFSEILIEKTRGYNNVSLIQEWVGPGIDEPYASREVSFYSNPRFNALSKHKQLEKVYPSVSLVESKMTKVTSFKHLVDSLSLTKEKLNILVVEAPYFADSILRDDTGSGLSKFDWMVFVENANFSQSINGDENTFVIGSDTYSIVLFQEELNCAYSYLKKDSENKYKSLYESAIKEVSVLADESRSLANDIDLMAKELSAVKQRASDADSKLTEQNEVIEKLKAETTSLKKSLQEKEYRQQLLNDELIKAEAQIELIKDIVIKEKAF